MTRVMYAKFSISIIRVEQETMGSSSMTLDYNKQINENRSG